MYTLVGEDPALTTALERLAQLAAPDVEFTTADFGGVRTEADTVKILKYREDEYALYVKALAAKDPAAVPKPINDWRKIAPFGKSLHNWGAARDLKPTKWPTGKSFQWAHDRLDALCESDPELKATLKIGDYFNDEPHVELRITLEEARHRYVARLHPPAMPQATPRATENQV
jgi:hypothetical protein